MSTGVNEVGVKLAWSRCFTCMTVLSRLVALWRHVTLLRGCEANRNSGAAPRLGTPTGSLVTVSDSLLQPPARSVSQWPVED